MNVNCYTDSQDVCLRVKKKKTHRKKGRKTNKQFPPPLKGVCTLRSIITQQSSGRPAFFQQAPLLWNNLLYSLQHSFSAASLKSALKNQLFPSEHQTAVWLASVYMLLCVSMYMHCVCACACMRVLEVTRQTLGLHQGALMLHDWWSGAGWPASAAGPASVAAAPGRPPACMRVLEVTRQTLDEMFW